MTPTKAELDRLEALREGLLPAAILEDEDRLSYSVEEIRSVLIPMPALILAARNLDALEPKDGWWSYLRSVLAQGTDIHKDYMAGKFADYEEYSARLDAAAKERAAELLKEDGRG